MKEIKITKEEISKVFYWGVYYYDPRSHQIVPKNIFSLSWRFLEDCEAIFNEAIKLKEISEGFKTNLKSACMFSYWSKAEYEVLINPLFENKSIKTLKTDINKQINLNWDAFIKTVINDLKAYVKGKSPAFIWK